MKVRITILSMVALAMLLAGCSSDEGNELLPNENPIEMPEGTKAKPRQDIELTFAESFIMKDLSEFSFRCFKEVMAIETGKSENKVVCPLSLNFAMGMLMNGLSDEARTEMIKEIFPDVESMEMLNSFNSKIAEGLMNVDNTAVILVNNSIWYDNTIELNSLFRQEVEKWYEAETGQKDMYAVSSGYEINEWVDNVTNGLIPAIFPEGSAPSTPISLINTLYFKGSWAAPFDPKDTFKKNFYNASASVSSVDMMIQKLAARYIVDEDMKCVEIPYGNSAFSFYAVMPEGDLASFIDKMDFDYWQNLISTMHMSNDVTVTLPKFKAGCDNIDIKRILMNYGLNKVFDSEESLEGLCSGDLKSSDMQISQTTCISVEETGSEGASETHLGFVTGNIGESVAPVNIEIDHPFLYLIQEKSTGAIIMMGVQREM